MRWIFLILLLCGCAGTDYDRAGQSFLGKPYCNSPLGEGAPPDDDPLIRFDAFDCTTFVETVLANGNLDKLNKIRYKNAKVDFFARNHFVETDWLKNNAELMENVSSKYAKTAIRTVEIDKENWFKHVHGLTYHVPPQTADIEYIPYEYVSELNPKNTMVVLFVADNPKIRDKIGTDLAITHMGLWLPNGMLRHASSEHGKVVDVDAKQYMKTRQKNKYNLGIVLVDIKK